MTTNEATVSYNELATAALAANDKEAANKGKAINLCFSALYLASKDKKLSNLNLATVAMVTGKVEKGEAYRMTFDSVFKVNEEEETKIPATFKNKLKLAFDVLAYVAGCEAKAGHALVKFSGDKVRVNGLLLNPADETEADMWYSLDKSAKLHTSITELQRKARKFMETVTGEALPASNSEQGRKGKADAGEGASDATAWTLQNALAFVSSRAQLVTEKGRASKDLLEEAELARIVLTELLATCGQNTEGKSKKAA
jgi:hypothetical protein